MMLNLLRNTFNRVDVKPLSLRFELEEDSDGRHFMQIYTFRNGRKKQVRDVRRLWAYGYREEQETEDGKNIYVLRDNDRQTLLSLRSMNPEIRKDGVLAFDMAPSVLRYLRGKKQVVEGEYSRQTRIMDEPLVKRAEIDFDPGSGAILKTGRSFSDTDDIIPQEQIEETADEDYVRIGRTFAKLPEKTSKQTQELLEQPLRKIPLGQIPEFFVRDLALIKDEFSTVLTQQAAEVHVATKMPPPVIRVNKDSSGWLDLRIHFEIDNQPVLYELLNKRSENGYCRVNENTWVAPDSQKLEEIREHMERMGAVRTQDGFRIAPAQFAALEEFIDAIGGYAQLTEAYTQFIDQLTDFQPRRDYPLGSTAEAVLAKRGIKLRPYQRAGIHWMHWLQQNQLHGVLADDMGLGKTIQSICALRFAYDNGSSSNHSLVVSPKSVMNHWVREFGKFYPGMAVRRYHGPGRTPAVFRTETPTVFVSTYSTVANDAEFIATIPFSYIILDEATYIKNPNTKRAKAIKSLNAVHRLALTGTPVENRAGELWSLFDFLMRGHLGRFGTFSKLFENPITSGDRDASDRLGRRIRPFLLRRTKGEVAKDLPKKIEMDEWCELTKEQARLYAGLIRANESVRASLKRGETINYTTCILPLIQKLKQICDHPALVDAPQKPIRGRSDKFDWILDRIEHIYESGEKVLVFSHLLGTLDLIETVVRRESMPYIRIDGSTNHRQELIDEFNEGEAAIALCSIKAVGHGVNMTAGNHVIHANRWWNPAIEQQATDRAHRIGQERTVYVYKILIEGTLEERIDRLLERKRNIAGQIMGAATSGTGKWTRDEILSLLKPLE